MKITFLTKTPSSHNVYTVAEIRQLDAAAIADGVPGIQLMKRAALAAFTLLLERFPEPEQITIYCGSGNNAGDGYVLAALAAQRCLPVHVIQVGDPNKLTSDAQLAYQFALQEKVSMQVFSATVAPKMGVVVDALLGIGLTSEPKAQFALAIEQINHTHLPVVALDIPSGLAVDTGTIQSVAVAAKLTVTFIGLKRGLLTGRGPAVCGEICLAELDIPEQLYRQIIPSVQVLALGKLLPSLPPRAADAHKGHFGHVLVIGGDTGYGGAALMAAEAAARTGAGLVSIATRPEHIPAILARRPEIMACGVVSGQELEPWLTRPTVLVVGPGLGRSPWSEQMLQQAFASGLPMVLDADALNILAAGRVIPAGTQRDNWLLTPHPGEAARLLDVTTFEVQADRFMFVQALQQRYGGTVILKGAGSLIASKGAALGIVTEGNPGMATGGMGDMLSGILGGLLAQGVGFTEAAQLGACLHAEAADLAAQEIGERSLLATDLIPYLCQLLSD